jgi:hypothetical protein
MPHWSAWSNLFIVKAARTVEENIPAAIGYQDTPLSAACRPGSHAVDTNGVEQMNTLTTTAVLDMHEALDTQRTRSLEEILKADAGVVSVGKPDHLPRLLLVAYNAARTTSPNIVKRVRSGGHYASIVGCA